MGCFNNLPFYLGVQLELEMKSTVHDEDLDSKQIDNIESEKSCAFHVLRANRSCTTSWK